MSVTIGRGGDADQSARRRSTRSRPARPSRWRSPSPTTPPTGQNVPDRRWRSPRSPGEKKVDNNKASLLGDLHPLRHGRRGRVAAPRRRVVSGSVDGLTSTEGIVALAARRCGAGGADPGDRVLPSSCARLRSGAAAGARGRGERRPGRARRPARAAASWPCATGSRRPPPASSTRMGAGGGPHRRLRGLPLARPLRRLRRDVRAPVELDRAAGLAPLGRGDVLDPAPRERARVRQAGRARATSELELSPEEQEAVDRSAGGPDGLARSTPERP